MLLNLHINMMESADGSKQSKTKQLISLPVFVTFLSIGPLSSCNIISDNKYNYQTDFKTKSQN